MKQTTRGIHNQIGIATIGIALSLIALVTSMNTTEAAELNELVGTWTMTSETLNSTVGTVESPITNKIVEFRSDGIFSEDYSQLAGYNVTTNSPDGMVSSICTTSGLMTNTFTTTETGIEVNPQIRQVLIAPNVECTVEGSATTNAVPFALSAAPTGTWTIVFSNNGQTMTASGLFGSNTLVQVYTKNGGTSINTNTNSSTNTNGLPPNSNQSPTNNQGVTLNSAVITTLNDEATAAYALEPVARPIQYSYFTIPTVVLTNDQRIVLQTQLENDIRDNTAVNVDENATVEIVRERGLRPKNRNNQTVTLTGRVDTTYPNLPADLQQQPAYVVITFFSEPVVRIAQVDSNGQWSLTIPSEALTDGEHTVFASAEVNAVHGDQIQITKFVVKEQTRLSNTTWLVIINGMVALFVVILLVVVQIKRSHSTDIPQQSA